MTREHWQRRTRGFFDTPRGRAALWILGVAFGAFLLGYLFTALLFFPGRGRSDVVTVPDVRGLSELEARRLLDRVGLELDRGRSLVHPEVPEGAVLVQSPMSGREVSPGSAVRVTLSAGRDRRAVPDVSALTAEQAQTLLTRTGFEVQTVEIESPHRAGTVLEVQPSAGTLVELPARVQLVLSAGPPPVDVPDLSNLPEPQARDALQAVGLRLGEVEYDPYSTGVLGGVIAQRPAAGERVPAGSQVHVIIAGSPPWFDVPPNRY